MTIDHTNVLLGLPGSARILEGLHDLAHGLHSVSSCLVRIARPRLTRAGLLPKNDECQDDIAELELYELLTPEGSRAYSCYNALIRELVSFEHALDQRLKIKIASLDLGGLPTAH